MMAMMTSLISHELVKESGQRRAYSPFTAPAPVRPPPPQKRVRQSDGDAAKMFLRFTEFWTTKTASKLSTPGGTSTHLVRTKVRERRRGERGPRR